MRCCNDEVATYIGCLIVMIKEEAEIPRQARERRGSGMSVVKKRDGSEVHKYLEFRANAPNSYSLPARQKPTERSEETTCSQR